MNGEDQGRRDKAGGRSLYNCQLPYSVDPWRSLGTLDPAGSFRRRRVLLLRKLVAVEAIAIRFRSGRGKRAAGRSDEMRGTEVGSGPLLRHFKARLEAAEAELPAMEPMERLKEPPSCAAELDPFRNGRGMPFVVRASWAEELLARAGSVANAMEAILGNSVEVSLQNGEATTHMPSQCSDF